MNAPAFSYDSIEFFQGKGLLVGSSRGQGVEHIGNGIDDVHRAVGDDNKGRAFLHRPQKLAHLGSGPFLKLLSMFGQFPFLLPGDIRTAPDDSKNPSGMVP